MRQLPYFKSFILRGKRARIALAHDIVVAALSFVAALYLRVGGDFSYFATDFVVFATAIYTAIAAAVFWSLRLYAGVWRYASLEDLVAIIRAATIITLVFLAAMFLVSRLEFIPRSALPISWLVLLALLGGPRFVYRLFKDRRANDANERDGERRIPVLLIGAGDSAELFIRAINRARQSAWHAVGLVDEKGRRVGRNIHGVQVLGDIDDIPAIVARMDREGRRPQRLIVTKSRIEGDEIKRLLSISEDLGIGLARMPQLDDFRENIDGTPEIRPINIEDLLGRPQASLDRDSMAALIGGRRVLVTGAGGTIGSELCRQIAAFKPAAIALLDSSEFQLYLIDMEIGEKAPDIPRHAILADVRDKDRIGRIFGAEQPELVFHAAALKHVPMVELHPDEGSLDECSRHPRCCRCLPCSRGSGDGADLYRQGCKPVEYDGGNQAGGGKLLPGAGSRGGGARSGPDVFRDRPVRECSGLDRFRRPPVPAPAGRGWTADGHAPGYDALFHDRA